MLPGFFDSVLSLIGVTPMVRLRRVTAPDSAEVLVKLEGYNPAGSVKDRAAGSFESGVRGRKGWSDRATFPI